MTVLIYKKGDADNPSNWRSISLCRTIYKLYAGCLAGRLTEWLTNNAVLSPCQKGFLHINTLRREMEKARTSKSDKRVAWLDISNAFGAIPHLTLEAAIERCEAGQGFLEIVRNIYQGATSAISVAERKTSDIPVMSGTRQGCPLSGLLFILAIDPIVSALQGTNADHCVLAFSDDLCLLPDSPTELQNAIESAQSRLG